MVGVEEACLPSLRVSYWVYGQRILFTHMHRRLPMHVKSHTAPTMAPVPQCKCWGVGDTCAAWKVRVALKGLFVRMPASSRSSQRSKEAASLPPSCTSRLRQGEARMPALPQLLFKQFQRKTTHVPGPSSLGWLGPEGVWLKMEHRGQVQELGVQVGAGGYADKVLSGGAQAQYCPPLGPPPAPQELSCHWGGPVAIVADVCPWEPMCCKGSIHSFGNAACTALRLREAKLHTHGHTAGKKQS